MKKTSHPSAVQQIIAWGFSSLLCFGPFLSTNVSAESAADYIAIPPLINSADTEGDKPNVLLILDNSNSMDEAPTGQAVGSNSPGSKSEILRNAVKGMVNDFGPRTRIGLMAYQQSGVSRRALHDAQYDVSYNPANYNPDYTGGRDSLTKRSRVPNPVSPGEFIYYNVALPFYSNSSSGNRFCYSSTADFDNGSEHPSFGPWDSYSCFGGKRGPSDAFSGFFSRAGGGRFFPTDSDFALNILDFGTHLSWQFIGNTWFSNRSPGLGVLHASIGDVEGSHKTLLLNKLATSQFSVTTDTPIRNAGLTPLEGSLTSAYRYYSTGLSSAEALSTATSRKVPTSTNVCGQNDYVVLVTDGLPSVDKNGSKVTDVNKAINDAASVAAQMLADGIQTFVVGFALPFGTDPALLDKIAAAGGTESTYLADNAESLQSALASIFQSFNRSESAAASSAVIASNARGEGAIYQALYNPSITREVAGKDYSVSWVGNLFGLFVDEAGFLREDTNGDAALGNYSVDRVAEFFFNEDPSSEAFGTTQVRLYTGSGDTPPNLATASPSATIDLYELGTIWEARDQLAAVDDVLTQRSYSALANTGRHIISSFDGKKVFDFVTSESISDLEAQAKAFRDQKNQDYLNLKSKFDALSITIDEATATLAAAGGNLQNAEQDLINATNALVAAQAAEVQALADVNTLAANIAATEADILTKKAELATAQSAFDSAKADFDHQEALYNSVLEELNTATADRDAKLLARDNLVAEVETARLLKESLETQLVDLNAQLVTAEADLVAANAALTPITEALALANTELASATTKRDASQATVDTAAAAVATSESTISGIEANLVTANSNLASSNAVLTSRQAVYDSRENNYVNNAPSERAALTSSFGDYDSGLGGSFSDFASATDEFDLYIAALNPGGALSAVPSVASARAAYDNELAALETARDNAKDESDDISEGIDDIFSDHNSSFNDLVANDTLPDSTVNGIISDIFSVAFFSFPAFSNANSRLSPEYTELRNARQNYIQALLNAGAVDNPGLASSYNSSAAAEQTNVNNVVSTGSDGVLDGFNDLVADTVFNWVSFVDDLDIAKQDVADDTVVVDALNANLATANTQLSAEKATLTAAEAVLATDQAAFDTASAEQAAAQAAFDSADQARIDAEAVVAGLNTSIATTESDLTAATTDHDTKMADLATAETELAAAETVVSDKTAIVDAEKATLDTLAEFLLNATTALTNATNALAAAEQQLVDFNDAVAPTQAAYEAAQQATIDATAAVELANNIIDGTTDPEGPLGGGDPDIGAEAAFNEALASLQAAQEQLVTIEASLLTAESELNTAKDALRQAKLTNRSQDNYAGYLDLADVTEIDNLISYIRGKEIPGYRSRITDINSDGKLDKNDDGDISEIWRLGDIVHSSPALVSSPSEGYDVIYGDETYAAFRDQYKDRRQVLYVGANDGMLHAFNAGFWDRKNSRYLTSMDGKVAHPLGSELWAYIPRAALPHLQWLKEPNYGHAYYVDGAPYVFDANIFPRDGVHPFGWGTVLMVGMRFGGGDIGLDTNGDGTDDKTMRSSYILFDVTNPEVPPVFMGEITHSKLGFTTSFPRVIKKREKAGATFNQLTRNDWYVAFGSGPTDFNDGTSDQDARLYLYDLVAKGFVSGFKGKNVAVSGNDTYVGDIAVQDRENDYVDDVIYFGVNGGDPATSTTGHLRRAVLSAPANSSVSTVIDAGDSITAAPVMTVDQSGNSWVMFGTGRLFSFEDNLTSGIQNFYGVIEPRNEDGVFTLGEVQRSNLEPVSAIKVKDDGSISRNGNTIELPVGTDVNSFPDFVSAISNNRSGWVREFDVTDGRAERSLSQAARVSNLLLFTSYTPGAGTCQPEGFSRLYALDYRVGIPPWFAPLDADHVIDPSKPQEVETYVDLGRGLASGVTITGGNQWTTTKSTSEFKTGAVNAFQKRDHRTSWRRIRLID